MTTAQVLNRTASPTVMPVTVAQAKKHLELLASGSDHDAALTDAIDAATEQFEQDTGYALLNATYTVSLDVFPSGCIAIPIRPVQSITSLTYYDSANAQQTLATTVYGLDAARREVYLKYNQSWPSITEQRNGIVVTMLCGFGDTAATVPRLIRQAILLQTAKWFQHRDMTENTVFAQDITYERIVRRLLRTSYP